MKTENTVVIATLIIIGFLGFYPIVKNGMLGSLVSDPVNKRASACERFMSGIAQEFQQSQLCGKIRPDAVGGAAGLSPPGYQVSYERSDCFHETAIETKNQTLCAEVRPVSTPSLDGSKINQANCVNDVKNSNGRGGSVPPSLSDDQLGIFMKQLGYTDQVLLQAQAGPVDSSSSLNPVPFNTAIYNLFQSIRTNPDFLSGVEKLPSYDEPLASSSARIPNNREYLYDTVATSVNKPDLCGRISPNTYIAYPNMVPNYDNFLRDECYHDVAVHFLNPAICDKITPRNLFTEYYLNSSSGRRTSASLNNVDGCKADVDIAKSPAQPYGKLSAMSTQYDGTYLGGYDAFAKVLSELGYQASSTPTSANYYGWNNYLQDLLLTPGLESQKNDFLNKVTNLQCQT